MLELKLIQKYSKKSVSQLLKLAAKYFNAFIRARDSKDGYFTCISCQTCKDASKMNAGHYLSSGHNSFHRFNEDNVHGQCIRCNMYMSGNLINYRKNLVEKIGKEKVITLEQTAGISSKWDRFTLIEIITKYKTIIKK